MNKKLRLMASILGLTVLLNMATPVFATNMTEKGQITYGEFIRAAVVETAGEQPVLMDTHYLMTYMLKANDLGLVKDIKEENFDKIISRNEMTEILSKMESTSKEKLISKMNTLLVETVMIDNKVIDMKGLKPIVKDGNVMVPLRSVSEALGFKVTWEKTHNKALLDNGAKKMEIQLGYDNYKVENKNNQVLVEKQLGTTPSLIDNSTYVPAQVFNLLLDNANSITVENGILNIISK